MADRKLDKVTQNSSKRQNPNGNLEGNPNMVPAYVGSIEPPKNAKTVRGTVTNGGTGKFGRGDGKERDYPTAKSNI
jgi:hypothetical protein